MLFIDLNQDTAKLSDLIQSPHGNSFSFDNHLSKVMHHAEDKKIKQEYSNVLSAWGICATGQIAIYERSKKDAAETYNFTRMSNLVHIYENYTRLVVERIDELYEIALIVFLCASISVLNELPHKEIYAVSARRFIKYFDTI